MPLYASLQGQNWCGRADWPQAAFTAAAATSKSSLVYILRLNAISYVDAVDFQRSQLALCLVGLANWHKAT
jgi:hypothetical protein